TATPSSRPTTRTWPHSTVAATTELCWCTRSGVTLGRNAGERGAHERRGTVLDLHRRLHPADGRGVLPPRPSALLAWHPDEAVGPHRRRRPARPARAGGEGRPVGDGQPALSSRRKGTFRCTSESGSPSSSSASSSSSPTAATC